MKTHVSILSILVACFSVSCYGQTVDRHNSESSQLRPSVVINGRLQKGFISKRDQSKFDTYIVSGNPEFKVVSFTVAMECPTSDVIIQDFVGNKIPPGKLKRVVVGEKFWIDQIIAAKAGKEYRLAPLELEVVD